MRGLTIRRIGAGGVEGEPVSAGIAVADSPASKIVGNDVVNDVKAFQADGADILNSRGSLVRGNKLNHNSWNGLVLIESPGSRIAGNELDGNGNNGHRGQRRIRFCLGHSQHREWKHRSRHRARCRPECPRRPQHREGERTRPVFFDLHVSVIEKNSAKGNHTGIELTGGQSGSAWQSTHSQHRERESGYRDRGRRRHVGCLERQLAEAQHRQQEQGPRHRSDCRLDRRRQQSRKRQRDSAAVRERRLLGLRHGCVEWTGAGRLIPESARVISPVRGDGRPYGAVARRRARSRSVR